VNYSFENPY